MLLKISAPAGTTRILTVGTEIDSEGKVTFPDSATLQYVLDESFKTWCIDSGVDLPTVTYNDDFLPIMEFASENDMITFKLAWEKR